ncbi:MAG: hypothetical protein ABIQ01_05640 [Pseudolysinimonas sp.]
MRIVRRYDTSSRRVALLQAMDHLEAARAAVARATEHLSSADARDEVLAVLTHRRLRGDTFVLVERVWRLGVLLLGRGGTLYATGTTLRIDELKFDNHQSNLAAARREYRAAALRAGFRKGETVNFDATPLELDAGLARSDGPVVLTPEGVQVRWSAASAALAPLESYLAERVELLADPPPGA